jgi:phosphate transport system substrate-binding protein
MYLRRYLIPVLCLAVISYCNSCKSKKPSKNQPEPPKAEISGSFAISGAFALCQLAEKWADEFMQIHPGVKIAISTTGTGQGIADLSSRKIQLAMISRPMSPDEKEAGIWTIPVAKDGVAPIVNQKNPYLNRLMQQGLSPDEFQKVFTSDNPLSWGELLDTTGREKAIAYSRADESGAADMFAAFFFKKATDLKGIKVTGDYEMIKSIQQNPLGIGFCNFSFAFDVMTGEKQENIQVIPFDLDYDNKIERKEIPFKNLELAHRSVWLGLYPETLCRELLIGSMGKPSDPAILEFLRFVLTEGQENVREMGLCVLNDVYVRYALECLK